VDIPRGSIGIATKPTTDGGAMVTAVLAGGPAERAGIRVGDIIQALNGAIVKGEGFDDEIATFKPGTKIVLSYMRGAWSRETLVTVGKNPM
jgi:S1-C subfamily serine protease